MDKNQFMLEYLAGLYTDCLPNGMWSGKFVDCERFCGRFLYKTKEEAVKSLIEEAEDEYRKRQNCHTEK